MIMVSVTSKFDDILLEYGGLPHVLPLAVHLFFCAEQVETSFMLKSCCWMGWGGWVDHQIFETAQSPNSSFPFLFDFWLGLWTLDLDSGLSISYLGEFA